jgi:hypothetical protein
VLIRAARRNIPEDAILHPLICLLYVSKTFSSERISRPKFFMHVICPAGGDTTCISPSDAPISAPNFSQTSKPMELTQGSKLSVSKFMLSLTKRDLQVSALKARLNELGVIRKLKQKGAFSNN